MNNFGKAFALAVAMLAGSVLGAKAAPTLSINGGADYALPGIFDPGISGIADGETIKVFYAGSSGGLELLNGPGSLLFTYLGKEAGYTNVAVSGVEIFRTGVTSAGAKKIVDVNIAGTSFVPLQFKSVAGGSRQATNGGTIDSGAGLGFLQKGSMFYAFFDDGGAAGGTCGTGDCDFDDLIMSIQVVPLPAAGILLLCGLGGLGFVSGRRNAA